jgi:heme oxygenase (biliverdin-IX-beta and delta-forming)
MMRAAQRVPYQMPSNGTSELSVNHESIHEQLRRATGEQHRRVDHGLRYVLTDQLSAHRYVKLLGAFLGFYAPLEDSLASWEATAPPLGLPLVRRSALLQRDLRALGSTPENIPMCAHVPTVRRSGEIAGAIYVVEGACLGGQVIARAVVQRLGIGRETGAAFFTGDDAGIAVRWRQVLAWLEAREHGEREDMIDGARRTFDAFSRWLLDREVLDE